MFGHDFLDTCRFGCLTCMGYIFLYLYLFSATEHVSHGTALQKYKYHHHHHHHYYYYYWQLLSTCGSK